MKKWLLQSVNRRSRQMNWLRENPLWISQWWSQRKASMATWAWAQLLDESADQQYRGRDVDQRDDLTREIPSWGATPQWSGAFLWSWFRKRHKKRRLTSYSSASIKLSRNLQAESSSNAQYLGLCKRQPRLIHKGGNANGRCCAKRKSRFRASQTRLCLGGRSHIGGDRLHL